MRIQLSVLLAVSVVSACSGEKAPADTTRVVAPVEAAKAPPADTAKPPEPEPAKPAPPPAPPPPQDSGWVMTPRGINFLETGMTLAQAKIATNDGLTLKGSGTSACEYATLRDAPDGIWVMLRLGKVTRVEVRSGAITTLEGAKIGDTEARIKEIYGLRVEATPHKYVAGGHYLTVKPSTPLDVMFRTIFETDGKVVTVYRTGTLPSVANVEGCG